MNHPEQQGPLAGAANHAAPSEPPAPGPGPTLADVMAALAAQQQLTAHGFETLRAAIEMLLDRLAEVGGGPAPQPPPAPPAPAAPDPLPAESPPPDPAIPQIQAEPRRAAPSSGLGKLRDFGRAISEQVRDLSGQIGGGTAAAGRSAASPAGQPAAARDDGGRIKDMLFGPDMANNERLMQLRDALLRGLLAGQREATNLAGQLLIFQSATAEKMPLQLKEIGEAYYAWNFRQAQGDDPLRDGLITYLHRKCEAAGMHNTIALVRPGDRYDSVRHNARSRGVEVAEVHGWVVLRDNGKVYTKANVEVR